MTTILVTGSRGIKSKIIIDHILNSKISKGDYVIQGGAEGVDSITLDWCNEVKHEVNFNTIYPVNKKIKNHYLHRNAEMVGMCDWVIAIWDGKSRGTKFTIDYARARSKPIWIFNENGELMGDTKG